MANRYGSDLHPGHRQVISMGQRPFASLEEMDAALMERWGQALDPVRPEPGVLRNLEDVALGLRQFLRQHPLPPEILTHPERNALVAGNNDGVSTTRHSLTTKSWPCRG